MDTGPAGWQARLSRPCLPVLWPVIRAVPGQQRHTVAGWGVAGRLLSFPVLVACEGSVLPLLLLFPVLTAHFYSISQFFSHAHTCQSSGSY